MLLKWVKCDPHILKYGPQKRSVDHTISSEAALLHICIEASVASSLIDSARSCAAAELICGPQNLKWGPHIRVTKGKPQIGSADQKYDLSRNSVVCTIEVQPQNYYPTTSYPT